MDTTTAAAISRIESDAAEDKLGIRSPNRPEGMTSLRDALILCDALRESAVKLERLEKELNVSAALFRGMFIQIGDLCRDALGHDPNPDGPTAIRAFENVRALAAEIERLRSVLTPTCWCANVDNPTQGMFGELAFADEVRPIGPPHRAGCSRAKSQTPPAQP